MVVKQTATGAAGAAGAAVPTGAAGAAGAAGATPSSSAASAKTSASASSGTATTPRVRLEALARTMEFKWFVAHAVVVFSTLLMLVAWPLGKAAAGIFYRVALLSAHASFGIILFQKYSRTKPSFGALLRDDNFQYAIYTFWWVVTPRRVLALLPLSIFSLFHFLTYVRSYLLPALGHAADSPLVRRIDSIVKNCNEPLTVIAANFELLLAVQLVGAALTFARFSWVQLALYLLFFRLRYATSAYTRHAVKAWEVRVDQLLGHPSLPPQAKHYWAQAKSYLARIPGPVNKP